MFEIVQSEDTEPLPRTAYARQCKQGYQPYRTHGPAFHPHIIYLPDTSWFDPSLPPTLTYEMSRFPLFPRARWVVHSTFFCLGRVKLTKPETNQ